MLGNSTVEQHQPLSVSKTGRTLCTADRPRHQGASGQRRGSDRAKRMLPRGLPSGLILSRPAKPAEEGSRHEGRRRGERTLPASRGVGRRGGGGGVRIGGGDACARLAFIGRHATRRGPLGRGTMTANGGKGRGRRTNERGGCAWEGWRRRRQVEQRFSTSGQRTTGGASYSINYSVIRHIGLLISCELLVQLLAL